MTEEVRAPLAGNVFEVLVEVGAKVEEDDDLLIIEALKMENPIAAPCSGTVKEIRVKKGDKVAEDALLIVIE
ncbi:MAG: acetyl-CoA carboxylase biotin carboxyl carrier protein subunit [Gemmatimonadota bacterium]